jgi:hypothetical protein
MRPFPLFATLAVAAAIGPIATADPARPLLKGTYEVTRIRKADGTVQRLPDLFLTGSTVWARWAFAFDGDHVTVAIAVLDRDHGVAQACEVSLATDVTWTDTGFTVATDVSTRAYASTFSQLSSTAYNAARKGCNAHLGKGTFTITPGKTIRVENGGDVMFFVPTTEEIEKIDWRKHAPP